MAMQPLQQRDDPKHRAASHIIHALAIADDPGHILVVEDHPEFGQAMVQQLELFGHTVELAADGRSALRRVYARQPDLVILDVHLPDIDGYAVCAALKQNPETWRIPVIMITAETEYEARLLGIEAEADQYLHKPVDARELEVQIRVLLRVKRRTDRMEKADDVIFSLARAVEAKDAYTEGHLQRLAQYACALGERLGLSTRELEALRYGAILHDVGKLGVDERIIRKRGPLTFDERAEMQEHSLIGERIVQPLHMAGEVAPIVRHHHERWDGCGYPDGLTGSAIPLGARIVAVADAFDAMTTQRPYNIVLSPAEAVGQLLQGAGSFWDPDIVVAFVDLLGIPLASRAVGE
ncbi:MAG: response regulator [Roseiflexaceae bacterium]|nr:response regulator [Roseiflexaceae bacterium]